MNKKLVALYALFFVLTVGMFVFVSTKEPRREETFAEFAVSENRSLPEMTGSDEEAPTPTAVATATPTPLPEAADSGCIGDDGLVW